MNKESVHERQSTNRMHLLRYLVARQLLQVLFQFPFLPPGFPQSLHDQKHKMPICERAVVKPFLVGPSVYLSVLSRSVPTHNNSLIKLPRLHTCPSLMMQLLYLLFPIRVCVCEQSVACLAFLSASLPIAMMCVPM